jgi:NADH-quinone oxidoreductase chain G
MAGIHVPTFCHHEKLESVGACRMCLVEIEGARGLQTSCTTPVRDGMVVKVHTSPAAVKARRASIEFLLTNHPLDCPVCDKGGECPLQDQALQDGPGESRYVEEKRHKHKRYPLSEFIVLDQERCVLCWRCIRFLDEWADDHELDLFGRGADTRIATFPGRTLSSKWQGNTIDICPVGALTSRVFRFEARVWELTNTPSVCPLCSVGCNIMLAVKNNRLRRITPRENLQVNDAWICDKGRFAHGFVDHPDRLRTPWIRRNGRLEHSTWEMALDHMAQRFNEILEADGPQAIAGLGSTRITNEANYLFQRFMRAVVGSNNVDHMGRVPVGTLPLSSLPELEHKDVILLLGTDPGAEAPLVELWIKKAVLRQGAEVLVVNSRQIELAAYGGPWLNYRPGSEVALLNALARVILDAGWESRTTRVTNLDDFRVWLKDYDPDRVEQITGVAADRLRRVAEILVRADRPAILYGPGWTWGRGRQASLAAVVNLSLLLGECEVGFVAEDCNTLGALEMGVVPDLYPGQQPFDDNKVRSRLSSFWGGRLSPVRGLDLDGMMASALEGRLKAMWIIGADPAHDCRLFEDALDRIPLLVVQDLFMTDTARLAEVVLPAASYAETGGSLINLTGRLQLIQAAVRPPGQARPDWSIIVALARCMVEGKRRRSWAFSSPADVLSEIAKVLPGYRGLDCAMLGDAGWQRPPPEATARRTFVRVDSEMPPSSAEYPLALATGRLLYDRGTVLRRSERIQTQVPAAYVMIHPTDADGLELADGDDVSVTSAQGQFQAEVKISDGIAPGVAFVPLNLSDTSVSALFADHRALPCVRITK